MIAIDQTRDHDLINVRDFSVIFRFFGLQIKEHTKIYNLNNSDLPHICCVVSTEQLLPCSNISSNDQLNPPVLYRSTNTGKSSLPKFEIDVHEIDVYEIDAHTHGFLFGTEHPQVTSAKSFFFLFITNPDARIRSSAGHRRYHDKAWIWLIFWFSSTCPHSIRTHEWIGDFFDTTQHNTILLPLLPVWTIKQKRDFEIGGFDSTANPYTCIPHTKDQVSLTSLVECMKFRSLRTVVYLDF